MRHIQDDKLNFNMYIKGTNYEFNIFLDAKAFNQTMPIISHVNALNLKNEW